MIIEQLVFPFYRESPPEAREREGEHCSPLRRGVDGDKAKDSSVRKSAGHPEGDSPRARLSAALVFGLASLALGTIALSDVVCVWDGAAYQCSGTGNNVVVSGGGHVDTNGVGVCTNCSAISPQDLSDLASSVNSEAGALHDYANQISDLGYSISTNLEAQNSEISTYRNDIDNWFDASNYMYTVSNSQTAGMLYAYENFSGALQVKRGRASGAGLGIWHYAYNVVQPQNEANLRKANSIREYAQSVHDSASSLQTIAGYLQEGAVACQGSAGGGTNGNGSATGPSTGDWCTYDQGEAIKDLLSELKQYAAKLELQLFAISNYTEQTVDAIRKGLFTDYTAIPDQSALGGDWRQIYISGAETNWGYEPTNILARIELLMYGLTGVGTNSPAFADDAAGSATEVMDEVDDHRGDLVTSLSGLSTDANGRDAQSLGSALADFFNALRPSSRSHAADEIVPLVQVDIGLDESVSIPALKVDEGGVSMMNELRSMCSTAAGIVYTVVTAWLVYLYWAWFAKWAVKMTKWATELLTALFAT